MVSGPNGRDGVVVVKDVVVELRHALVLAPIRSRLLEALTAKAAH